VASCRTLVRMSHAPGARLARARQERRLGSWRRRPAIARRRSSIYRAARASHAKVGVPRRDRLLDHEVGRVAATYNLYDYVDQKRYVAYAIENQVRKAIGMKPIAMPPRPLV
jgi:hypothetical protein